jgi:Ca2+-binding RTX toxin-like protein
VLTHVEGHVVGGLGWTSLAFFGGRADEDVDLQPATDPPAKGPVKVLLGAGDDRVQVDPTTRASLDGGAGNDDLKIFGSTRTARFTGTVHVDLTKQTYRVSGHGALPVAGFESATTWWFHDADLVGNAKPNALTALGCRVTLRGGGGNDTMRQEWRDECAGRPYYAHESGGPGDDTMYGGPWNDVLVGGPGRDTAYGSYGKDRCVAERRIAC